MHRVASTKSRPRRNDSEPPAKDQADALRKPVPQAKSKPNSRRNTRSRTFFAPEQPYNIYPDRDNDEFESLCRQIAEHGLLRPIVCTPEGHILSGHRRRRALEHLGCHDYPVEIVVGLSTDQKWARVHLENRHRVLSTAEKQQLGRAELVRNPQLSDRAIADLVGTCKETIANYRRAMEKAEEIPRTDHRIARNGQVHPAAKPRRHPVYHTRLNQAPRHAETLGRIDPEKLPASKIVLTNRDVVRAAHQDRREALASTPLVHQPTGATIYHCDFRGLAARAKLQRGQINLIWTDFPWSSEWLRSNGEAVADFANEYLAEDGAIATYFGNCPWLPELMAIMGTSLNYRGMLINLNQSQKKDRVFITKLARKARPIFVWSKSPNWTFDPNDLGFTTDVYQGDPAAKEGHDWAQPVGESVHWLARLSKPGDLIVDPCAGTGTGGVAVRCLGEGRRWIGSEIDEKTYRIARANLAADLPDGVTEALARTPRTPPSPALVEMPDGSTHRLETLLSNANYKQCKGQGYLSMGLTLTPRDSGGSGLHLCRHATAGCGAACFAGWDRLNWPNAKRAMVARTLLLARDPEQFRSMVLYELQQAQIQADERGVPLVCRLNVVSDVPWEKEWPELFAEFPRVRFMDYTKHVDRVLSADLPENYHLTFSRSEQNEADCRRVLDAGRNVVVVFRTKPLPGEYWGYRVIDGDKDDLRFTDPSPSVVGVVAKGAGARRDKTGFVVDL